MAKGSISKKDATIGQGGHEAQLPEFTWKKYGTNGQNVALNGKYNFASGTVFYALPNATAAVPSVELTSNTHVPVMGSCQTLSAP